MDLSVVIPLFNEQNSLEELVVKISTVVKKLELNHEIILIDDGSKDNSWKSIIKITSLNNNVKALRFLKNYGKSQALSAGFKASKGDVIITMDADLQDDPNEIPELYRLVKEEKFDLVSGWKKVRHDSFFSKNIPSKIFNWAARVTSGIKLNDFNCGIKAYKKDLINKIKLSGGMHRYIPGFLDLITLWFIHKFGKRPMHFFGLIGSVMLIIGFLFSIYLGFDKLFLDTSGRLITERPEFYIALTTMIMGSQFFLAGFLGEIILRNKKIKKQYIITEKINE